MGESKVNRSLYVARITLTQQAWDQNKVARLRELPNEAKELTSDGAEWHYSQGQAHQELLTLSRHRDWVLLASIVSRRSADLHELSQRNHQAVVSSQLAAVDRHNRTKVALPWMTTNPSQ